MILSMNDCCEASPVAQTVKNPPAVQETQVQSLGREDLLEEEMPTTAGFLPGEFHGQRSLVGCCARGYKRVEHNLATKLTTTVN